MSGSSTSLLWRLWLAALLGHALRAPGIGPEGRLPAALGLLVLLAFDRRRVLLLLAVGGALLGGEGGRRRVGEAVRYDGYEGPARLRLHEDALEGRAAATVALPGRGAVRARLSGLREGSPAGRILEAEIRLSLPPARRNPDDRDGRRAAWSRGALLRGWVKESGGGTQAGGTGGRDRLRRDASGWLRRRMGGHAGLWSALLLGDRRALEGQERFRRLGQAHLLALSGLHVGLAAGLLHLLLGRWLRPGWRLAPLAAWAWLVGAGPSVTRAVAMLAWHQLGGALGRERPPLEGLAAVGLVETLLRPHALGGLGWALSYAATAGILRALPALRARPWWWTGLALSFAAQAATLPWSLGAFGRLSPVGAPAHLLVGPLFGLLLCGGLLALGLAAVVPPLAPSLCAGLALADHGLGALLRLLDAVAPSPWSHPGIGGLAWSLALGMLAIWLVPGRLAGWRVRLPSSVAGLLLVHLLGRASGEASWWSLDVGQGDAGVYRCRGGGWLVVDAGGGHGEWDPGERVVLAHLRRRRARGVTLLLTHGHLDHVGGAPALLRSGRVGRLVLARCDSGRTWTRELLREAESSRAAVRWLVAGDTLRIGEETAHCLWPPAEAAGSSNDRSVVLVLGPPGRRLLLAGDLERPGERGLLARGEPGLQAVLKVAHHGGNTGTGEEWLAALRPRRALISCGKRNRHGHPHPATLQRIETAGCQLHRSDQEGALGLIWGGGRLRFRAVRAPP